VFLFFSERITTETTAQSTSLRPSVSPASGDTGSSRIRFCCNLITNKWPSNFDERPHRFYNCLSSPQRASPFWSRAFCRPTAAAAFAAYTVWYISMRRTTPKLPLTLGRPRRPPSRLHGSMGPRESTTQRHLGRFGHLCRAHGCVEQRDRQLDRQTTLHL